MPDDRFEDRLRAFARQISRSISEVDLDEVADRLGVDRDRIQDAAGAVETWLSDHTTDGDPLFSSAAHPEPASAAGRPPVTAGAAPMGSTGAGPHPLDLPTDSQGRALSALASARWTLRPGSGRLTSTEAGGAQPDPADHADLAGELRARDWITADGEVTLVGRQALLRWCRTAEAPGAPEPTPGS